MDKGAHFRKCDFQVHTPRDINWSGVRPTSETDRDAFAALFISKCREKGLGAVAITDHHDMEFVPYIQKAAAEELDAQGQPVSNEERIVVFPGMELTLVQPCQAILIFDASLTQDFYPIVYACLGIVPTPRTAETTTQTVQLPINLLQLHSKLDQHASLTGKFIVLPNVTEKGHQTLMRTGFHGHYIDMPCVGGYMDGPLAGSDGHLAKLSGKVKEWGFKSVGVFATSDCRKDDLATLGDHVTWVKWAEPTAEALRQACLARESRLSHVEPPIPHAVVTQVTVTDSKFLGNFNLELNPQYNAIIGGRGTGKSTILEYLRWALCDEPAVSGDAEAADFQAKRQRLVEKTLLETNGAVEVKYVKNGVGHTLRRSAKDRRLQIKIADGEFESATEEQIRAILPVQAYSQKQLSSVGVRTEQLLRFIEAPIRVQLDESQRQLLAMEGELRENFARFVRKVRMQSDLENLKKESNSLIAQVDAFRKKLTGISAEDRAILAIKPNADLESRFATRVSGDVKLALATLDQAAASLSGLPQGLPEGSNAFPNAELAVSIHGLIRERIEAMKAAVAELSIGAASSLETEATISKLLGEWDQKRADYALEYERVKQESSAHETVLKQLAELERQLEKVNQEIDLAQSSIASLGQPEKDFPELQSKWKELLQFRSSLLASQCESLTGLSSGRIRATLRQHGDLSKSCSSFVATMKGSNLRGQKVEELFSELENEGDPLVAYFEMLGELLSLCLLDKPVEDGTVLPATPKLSTKFSASELLRIANKFGPDEWLNMSLGDVASRPAFEYMTRENEYIDFEEASAGQQATALLWALLNQQGSPLIIDQPEDDLDSQVIVSIVNQVWNAKGGRQLIFSSHNANLVVNGDAELVVVCDYMVSGEQSKGTLKLQGAIDVKVIRDEIAQVMEGGKEAFRLRSNKYGF